MDTTHGPVRLARQALQGRSRPRSSARASSRAPRWRASSPGCDPNDLIWNYWVNNYLLGNKPPAFDILFWNADTTRLPAAFHADLLDIIENNPYVNAGKMEVLGRADRHAQGRCRCLHRRPASPTTSRRGRPATTRRASTAGRATFILANAGHLQSLLNPPGAPKSFFSRRKVAEPDPDDWAAGGARNEGSWWPHWMAWMQQRSGDAGRHAEEARQPQAPARASRRRAST